MTLVARALAIRAAREREGCTFLSARLHAPATLTFRCPGHPEPLRVVIEEKDPA